ncbi:ceramidase domain-containing protein [Janibacter sp. GS2]|uniref:ceramidase domain-containing protein n=1 Tax=Janibacter sp. GS2 TaxID=3442646 RepID=UPI003EBAFE3C
MTCVAAVSLVAWAVLVLAAWQGWLGAPVGRGAGFCEATRSGVIKQPVNAASNLGFTVAALAIALRTSRSTTGPRTAMTSFAVVVALLGPGSAAMHATETAVGGHLDLLSMYLLASFTAAYALVRAGWLTTRHGGWLFVVLVVVCEAIGALPISLPVIMHPGNAAFAALLLTTIALELVMVRRGWTEWPWGAASVGTLLLAFTVWNLAKDGSAWCSPGSIIQGHGIWHLLDALAAYFLARHYLAAGPAPRGPA